MTTDEAVDVIARHLLHAAVMDAGESWEAYPELGELDWYAVLARAEAIAPTVHPDEFDRAYELLAARASDEA